MTPVLYFCIFLVAILFLFLIDRLSWIGSHQKQIQQDPDAEPFVGAIYSSVKRYKDLYQSHLGDTYYCTARSKRYVLRISLSPVGWNRYSLKVDLEGEHQHAFSLAHPGWLSSKLVRMENRLYFDYAPRKDSGITKAEIMPFLESLSFFKKVIASEGLLSASRTLQTSTSMEDWPHVLGALIRLARFLMDTGMRKEILAVEDVLCPYCRGQFTGTESTVSCRECKTRHHTECWDEVGRCSVFGCNCKSEIIVTQA